jgi:hypothetical protein
MSERLGDCLCVSGTIHVRDVIAKKRGGRRIPMHPDLRRALERLAHTTEPVGPVIRSYRGSHLKANSVGVRLLLTGLIIVTVVAAAGGSKAAR